MSPTNSLERSETVRRNALPVVLLVLVSLLLVLVSKASSASDKLQLRIYGVAEDSGRNHRIAAAKARWELAAKTGFNAVRSTLPWVQGQIDLNYRDRAAIRNSIGAAETFGKTFILTVFPWVNTRTPVISREQWDFVNFLEYVARMFPEVSHFEIGNEPNLSRFWRPQFGPDGKNSSAGTYLRLLMRSYDRLKAINPEIVVIGGALASEGTDDPWAPSKTTSPSVFIKKLGEAYRASERTRPIMDWVSLHPYGKDSSEPPDVVHADSTAIGFADYPKLVKLLGEAFDGTAQEGSTISILYSEYGVDTVIPPERTHLYTGREPATTKPVTEEVQAAFYETALELAACQSTVVGVMFFHTTDEIELERWQSGIYYPDSTPKKSQPVVKKAIRQVQNGFRC